MDFIHNSADTDSNLSQEALCFLAYKLLRGSIKPGWYSGCESESHLVVSDSLRPHLLYSPWNLLGQNTGVGSLSLLQWIFRAQESNQGLPHCRRILYQLSYERSPIWLYQSNRFLVEDSSAWSDAKSGQWGISIRYCLFVCLATLSLGCCKGFSFSCGEWGLLFSCRTQISDCRDFSCC